MFIVAPVERAAKPGGCFAVLAGRFPDLASLTRTLALATKQRRGVPNRVFQVALVTHLG